MLISRPFRSARALSLGTLVIFGWLPSAEGQAILAPGGRTLFNQQILVRSFSRIDRRTLLRDGSTIETRRYIQPVAVVYGFAPAWHATAVTPFVAGESTGRGDSRFFVKYDGLVKKNEPGGLTRLAAEFGVQTPTGSEGFSTGAASYLGDLVFLKASKQRHILADVQYEAATRNSDGVTVGNRVLFDVALSYLFLPDSEKSRSGKVNGIGRLAPHGVFGIVEFNAEVRNRARDRAGALPNSGGGLLYISPGIEYFMKRNLILELSLPIPVVRKLNGVQPKPQTGVVFGFRYVL